MWDDSDLLTPRPACVNIYTFVVAISNFCDQTTTMLLKLDFLEEQTLSSNDHQIDNVNTAQKS